MTEEDNKYEWIDDCVELGESSENGLVHNQDLKDIVRMAFGISDFGNRWRNYSNVIKDKALENGKAFIPVPRKIQGEHYWSYDPKFDFVLIWGQRILDAHETEIYRFLKTLALPQYKGMTSPMLTIALRRLKMALDVALENLDNDIIDDIDEEMEEAV